MSKSPYARLTGRTRFQARDNLLVLEVEWINDCPSMYYPYKQGWRYARVEDLTTMLAKVELDESLTQRKLNEQPTYCNRRLRYARLVG